MICVPVVAKIRAALASCHNKTHEAEVLLSKLKKGSVQTIQHNAHMTISGTWIKCILWWTTKNALYDILLSFCTRPETVTVSMCFILYATKEQKNGCHVPRWDAQKSFLMRARGSVYLKH